MADDNFGGHQRWEPHLSNAEWLLKGLGLIPPGQNQKILSFNSDGYYNESIRILSTTEDERTVEDADTLPSQTRRALKDIIIHTTDTIACTTTASRNRNVPKWIKEADVVLLDEACAMTPGETVNSWQGDTKWVWFSGDPHQLPPACMSYNEKWKGTNHPVNKFANIQQLSFMKRLINRGWPVFLLNEQLRMCPGAFDLANAIVYLKRNWRRPFVISRKTSSCIWNRRFHAEIEIRKVYTPISSWSNPTSVHRCIGKPTILKRQQEQSGNS